MINTHYLYYNIGNNYSKIKTTLSYLILTYRTDDLDEANDFIEIEE